MVSQVGFLLFVIVAVTTANVADDTGERLCYTTNGLKMRERNSNNYGKSYKCFPEMLKAGPRRCIKFKLGMRHYTSVLFNLMNWGLLVDERPHEIIRDCDLIFDKVYGNDTFTLQGNGCDKFEAMKDGALRTGKYCMCMTDLCNGGPID